MEKELKKENIVDTIPTDFGAEEPEPGAKVKVLKSTLKTCCSIRENSLTDLEDQHELQTGSALTGKVILVLGDPPYNTRRAQGQSNSAHGFLSKRFMKDVVRVLGSVTAPRRSSIHSLRPQGFSTGKKAFARRRKTYGK